jgi:transcriptional regulator GlxA family with amidase domain
MAFLPLAAGGPARDDRAMKIEILLFDGFDDLDAFGPFEVLAGARLHTTFVTAEPVEFVTSAGGAKIIPHGTVGDPDVVLVPGGGWNDKSGPGCSYEAGRGVIPALLRERHAAGRRVGSVCTGAMLLAEAGILGGRRATTHHTSHADLRGYDVDVDEDARFVDEGDIITSAGITAGIDMALHLVTQALGEKAAEAAATELEWDRRVLA